MWCHSQTGGHRKRCDETVFQKMCNVTHKLSVIGCDETPFTKYPIIVAHKLLVIGKDCLSWNVQCHSHPVSNRVWWDYPLQRVQWHSLPVGHSKQCNETAFHKMGTATHLLLVIGKDVRKLPFTKYLMSLTSCWSWEKMWWDCASQNVQWWHSLPVGHRKGCEETAFHTMCNVVTHTLLVIGKMWSDWLSQNVQCHSQTVGHRKKCDQTDFHKMCNITDKLLVINVMLRLSLTKCAMLLTPCWLYIGEDVMKLPFTNGQHHSQAVSHRRRCDETAFTKCAMSPTPCWS